jgi:hypothetical protein
MLTCVCAKNYCALSRGPPSCVIANNSAWVGFLERTLAGRSAWSAMGKRWAGTNTGGMGFEPYVNAAA